MNDVGRVTDVERASWPPDVVAFFDDMENRIAGDHPIEHSPAGRAEIAARRSVLLAAARRDPIEFETRMWKALREVLGDDAVTALA